MRSPGLSRQIVLSMGAVALGVAVLIIVASYVFYYVLLTHWPEQFGEFSLLPTAVEWIWIVATTLISVLVASAVAVKLAQRILLPLNSVADTIRRVTAGDLTARATPGDRALGESARLADDVNALVDRLQRVTEEQRFWNAAIAHELRTPVTILRGRLQGLAEGVFAPSEAQFFSLLKQVEGLGRLIEDLRVVGLAENGRLDLKWEVSDLDEEVAAVVKMSEGRLAGAGLHPVLACQARHAPCDAVRIRQALLALLENAVKHAQPGRLLVGTERSGSWCRVFVEDDGPGVAEPAASDIFKAFHRLDGRKGSGSGLGLTVVAAIADAHGGSARCIPAEDGGSRFELSWPVDRGD